MLRRPQQHRANEAVAQLLGQIIEHLVARRLHVGEQLLHQLVVIVGELLQHVEAGLLLAIHHRRGNFDDLGGCVLAVDECAFERQIDETRGDAVLPDRDLAQHEGLAAGGLQDGKEITHARVETVDLVEEEEVGDPAILELLQNELEGRHALGIGLADHHGCVASGQDCSRLALEFNGPRAVYESERVVQKLHIGDVDLDTHAVIARFRRAVADRVLVGDLALPRDRS